MCAGVLSATTLVPTSEQVYSAVTRQVLPNALANVRKSDLVFKPVSPPWICMTADVIDALNSVSFIVDTIRA